MKAWKCGTLQLMTKLLGWDLVLVRKSPEEADKGGVLFSFSELFVSDFVGDLEGRVME